MGNFGEAEQLARGGRFADALQMLEQYSYRDDRFAGDALRVELLERTGKYAASLDLADRVMHNAELANQHRSTCELALAHIRYDEGDVDGAIRHAQRALSFAEASKDVRKACLVQLRLSGMLADRSGYLAVAPTLAHVRASAIKLGDPFVSAAFHVFVGELEAKRALIHTAVHHTRLGLSLLEGHDNPWLAAIAENTLSGIAIMQSDIEDGLKHGRRALELATESGGAALLRAALGNLGYLFYLVGDFDAALKYLQSARSVVPVNGALTIGMIETLARVSLAQGELARAASLMLELTERVKTPTDWLLYANRHSQLTLIDILIYQGQLDDARERVEAVLDLASRAGDDLLHVQALLWKVEVLSSLNFQRESSEVLRQLGSKIAGFSADVHARYYFAAALAIAAARPSAGRSHFERAMRIYGGLHSVPGQLELTRRWAQARKNTSPFTEQAAGSDDVPRTDSLLQNVAALMLHAGRPELVATGLLAILADTGGVVSATARATAADGSTELLGACTNAPAGDGPLHQHTLRIGEARSRLVEIAVTARTDVESVATLNAITLLLATVHDLERAHAEREERMTLWPLEDLPEGGDQAIVVGRLAELMALARRVARTNVSVLITGESGTGKEILARAIHRYSARTDKPFVPFNCAAIPREMLESQLFGHRRGAFTGADRDNPGMIRAARTGTLLLDEIGELSPELQPKLLRFLESGEISPLGEPAPLSVDVRIIAATNANLEQLVQAGRFREDLFYRLNVIRLSIPPLRERRDEIPALVHHFVSRAAQEFAKGRVRVAEETMEHLLLYPWPGNVRQLNNELRRMVALAEPDTALTPASLSKEILRATPRASPRGAGIEIAVPLTDKLAPTLSRIEREMIKAALKTNQGRVDAAAKALGISRKGLYLKRQRLGL